MDDERTVASDSIYQHYVAKQKSLHNIETKELVCISKDSRFHSSPESSPSFITSRHVLYLFVQSRVNSRALFVWSRTDTSMGRLFKQSRTNSFVRRLFVRSHTNSIVGRLFVQSHINSCDSCGAWRALAHTKSIRESFIFIQSQINLQTASNQSRVVWFIK